MWYIPYYDLISKLNLPINTFHFSMVLPYLAIKAFIVMRYMKGEDYKILYLHTTTLMFKN